MAILGVLVGFTAGWVQCGPLEDLKTLMEVQMAANLLRPRAFGGLGAEGMKKEIPSSLGGANWMNA